MGLTLLNLFNSGCAPQSVSSVWPREKIVADGAGDEWRQPPQYYDEDHSVTIRVSNDNDAIHLFFLTTDDALAKQLTLSGLTLWIDPLGGSDKTFGIHLPSLSQGMPGKDIHGLRNPAAAPTHHKTGYRQPAVKMPDTLKISYSDATAPLEMTLAEIRNTGIDIGVGQRGSRGLVCEFTIRFAAAPCLSGLAQGTIAGIGFSSDTSSRDIPDDQPTFGRGGRSGGRGRRRFRRAGQNTPVRQEDEQTIRSMDRCRTGPWGPTAG